MYNILTLNKISQSGLSKLDNMKYNYTDKCENPDGIIVRSASMHNMNFPKSLLAVARAGAGYNNIPVDKCTENGVCVFNTPGANANAVKELVICSLFLSSRKIINGCNWCKTLNGVNEIGKEIESAKNNFSGPEIHGKTLGVIGLGAIGIKVCNSAVALGMNVIGYDPYLSDKAASMLDKTIVITSKLHEIFSESDYISLHAPLTELTKNLINDKTINSAKDGVRVLNFARGELVDENAIISAIVKGKCSAYITDFPTEKMIGIDGIVTIPHLGASTPESEENCAVMAVNQIVEYIEKGNVINSVNFPCVSKAIEKDGQRIIIITKGDISEIIFSSFVKFGVNADNSTASIKKNVGYIIIDTDKNVDLNIVDTIKSFENVISVRVIDVKK